MEKGPLSLYLLVPGANLSIEVQSFLGCMELPSVQQISTDHHTSSPFSRLTVDRSNMLLVFTQPLIQILTERFDQLQLGRVVVLKSILSHCQRNRPVTERQAIRERQAVRYKDRPSDKDWQPDRAS